MAGWGKHMGIDTYTQEEQMNCGMASLAMVICWAKGDKLNTSILAHESKRVGGPSYYRPALADNKTMHKVMPGSEEWKVACLTNPVLRRVVEKNKEEKNAPEPVEPRRAGAGHGNLRGVLKAYGISASIERPDTEIGGTLCYKKETLKAALQETTDTKPAIVGLADPPHFVVCRGWRPGSDEYCVIVDPANGRVYDGAHVSSDSKIIFRHYNTLVDILIVVKG